MPTKRVEFEQWADKHMPSAKTDAELKAKHDAALKEAAQRDSGALTLIGRVGYPTEIANAALFQASDESSFMTGDDLLVDGGYNAL